MVVFLAFGLLTFLITTGVIALTETSRRVKQVRWLRLKIGRAFRLYITATALAIIATVLLTLMFAALIYLTLFQIANPSSLLYRPIDFITSDLFASGLLGVIFGGILSTWLARMVRLGTDEQPSFLQKIEGAALLLLFILGTTSVSLKELIHSFSISTGVVSFQLQATATGNQKDAGPGGSAKFPFTKPSNRRKGEDASPGSESAAGFAVLLRLHNMIRADLNYLNTYRSGPDVNGKQIGEVKAELTAAADWFEHRLSPITKCMSQIVKSTNDHNYVGHHLSALRPSVREFFIVSRRADKLGDDELFKLTAKRLDAALKTTAGEILSHARRLRTWSVGVLTTGKVTPSLCTELEKLAGNPNGPMMADGAFVPPRSSKISERPYFALLYAALLDIDSQYVAAISELDDFAQVMKDAQDVQSIDFWFRLRVRGVLNSFFESYVDRQSQTSVVVLDRYLESLSLYIDQIKMVDAVKSQFTDYFPQYQIDDVEGRTLQSVYFTRDPGFVHDCSGIKDKPKSTVDALMNLGFLTTQALFALRALDHPRFETRYAQRVTEIIEKLSNTDLSCMSEFLGADETRFQRAEFLKTYALFKLKLIELKLQIGSDYPAWAKQRLSLAIGAMKLALASIDSQLHREAANGGKTKTLSKKLETSKLTELGGELVQLIRRTQLRLDAVSD
ncbi:MAG: hypothetical protein ACR2PM_01310 [Hyphomicrobiales bacterium]